MTLAPGFLHLPLAHRGLHDAAAGVVENSRAAFSAAMAAGYGIECDVQLTADGRAVVFHDYDVGRLTGVPGPVRGRTAAELAGLRLMGTDEGVPELAEVLVLVAGRAPLLIEIKDQDGAMGPDVGPLERAVAAALAGYGGPVAVMSFNPHAVAAFGAAAPGVARGLTTSAYRPGDWGPLPPGRGAELRGIPDYDRSGACFIAHEAADLGRPRVAELKRAGAAVLCWTVRSAEAEAEARRVAQNVIFEGYRADIPA